MSTFRIEYNNARGAKFVRTIEASSKAEAVKALMFIETGVNVKKVKRTRI